MKVNLFASEEQVPRADQPGADGLRHAGPAVGRRLAHAIRTGSRPKPSDDKLLILEDTDGDGRADKCTRFAGDLHESDRLRVLGGGVIVAQGPDILFLKDTNGDDRYDVKERIMHGMDTADTHHTANSFVLDPGGALFAGRDVSSHAGRNALGAAAAQRQRGRLSL